MARSRSTSAFFVPFLLVIPCEAPTSERLEVLWIETNRFGEVYNRLVHFTFGQPSPATLTNREGELRIDLQSLVEVLDLFVILALVTCV